MNYDKYFKVLDNIEMNKKRYILYFPLSNYVTELNGESLVRIMTNRNIDEYITSEFKCSIVQDVEYSMPSFIKFNNEIISDKEFRYDAVCGYYFLFDSENEMQRCINKIESIIIAYLMEKDK